MLLCRLSLLLVVLVLPAVSLRADLIGTTVDGGMFFHNNASDNYFDPTFIGSGTSAVIGGVHPSGILAGMVSPTFETLVEGDDFNLSADFSSAGLDISFAPYEIFTHFEGFTLSFTDPGFSGLNMSLASYGGPFTSPSQFSYSLTGDTVTFDVIDGLPTTSPGTPYTADFSFSTATPEPAAGELMAIGLTAFAAMAVRRKAASNRPR